MTSVTPTRPSLLTRWLATPQAAQADMARDAGVYPFGTPFAEPMNATFTGPDGRPCVNLGSSNYLGLTTHPAVVAGARRALETYGTGASGSRLLNGTFDLHLTLEEELADFFGKPACAVFATGMNANLGTLAGLAGRGDHLLLDRESHASLIDGARLSGSAYGLFRHNDAGSLDHRLAALPETTPALVSVESVYSLEGSVAPVGELAAVARRHGAAVLVDEAHAVGVVGPGGRGVAAEQGCLDQADLITLPFSKALASCGGALVGPAEAVDQVRSNARAYIYTASNVPASIGAALAALRVLRAEPERGELACRNADRLRTAAAEGGWDVLPGRTPIVILRAGDRVRTAVAWRLLMDRGVFCNVAIPPAVPEHRGLLRLSALATHTPEQMDRCADAFAEVAALVADFRFGQQVPTTRRG